MSTSKNLDRRGTLFLALQVPARVCKSVSLESLQTKYFPARITYVRSHSLPTMLNTFCAVARRIYILYHRVERARQHSPLLAQIFASGGTGVGPPTSQRSTISTCSIIFTPSGDSCTLLRSVLQWECSAATPSPRNCRGSSSTRT